MKILLLATLLATLVVLSHQSKKDYTSHKVYRLIPKDEQSLQFLKKLQDDYTSGINFWSEPSFINQQVDVLIPPNIENNILNSLKNYNIEQTIFINDVQDLINLEQSNYKKNLLGAVDWTDYNTLDEIYSWLRNLTTLYPNVVTLFNAGTTYEGRDILGVKLSFSSSNRNRAVFIESNIHAREWITSATSTYILNQFLTSTDSAIRQVADSHDWYFVPVANPDGFVYTRTNDRMWRKTRVPYRLCYGADPNRNWDYHWMDGGASTNPCSETYAGPSAFSEPSTATLANFISSVADSLVGYISFHSYSQLLLLSYGHTTAHLDNYSELLPIGQQAIATLAQRYGTRYVTGNIAETIYVASGGSMDWVKGTFGTPVTYTYELRDTGRYGFILPPDQIVPTSLETLDSLISIWQQWRQLHPEYYQ